MATLKQDFTAIRTRFFQLWPSNVPTILDNDPDTPEPNTIWARLSIEPGSRANPSLGSRRYRQLGRIYLQIFVPAQTGMNAGWDLAEVFTTAFSDWRSPDYRIMSFAPDIEVFEDENDAYFTIKCSSRYWAEH